jgi:hypothetical protein
VDTFFLSFFVGGGGGVKVYFTQYMKDHYSILSKMKNVKNGM